MCFWLIYLDTRQKQKADNEEQMGILDAKMQEIRQKEKLAKERLEFQLLDIEERVSESEGRAKEKWVL